MKEHLLTIVFLGLLVLLYFAPLPDSFLNTDRIQSKTQKEYQIDIEQNKEIPAATPDSIENSIVAATELIKNL